MLEEQLNIPKYNVTYRMSTFIINENNGRLNHCKLKKTLEIIFFFDESREEMSGIVFDIKTHSNFSVSSKFFVSMIGMLTLTESTLMFI